MTESDYPTWLTRLLGNVIGGGLTVETAKDGTLYAYDEEALTALWMDDDGQCVAEWCGTLESGAIRRTGYHWWNAASDLAAAVFDVVGDSNDYDALLALRDDLPWSTYPGAPTLEHLPWSMAP